VCEAIVDEVEAGILATPSQHSVQTRFRIDEKKRAPYARTEHNLLEIIEAPGFTRKFEQYGVVKPRSRSAMLLKQAFIDANTREKNEGMGMGVGEDASNTGKEASAAEVPPAAAAPVTGEEPVSSTDAGAGESAAAAAAPTPADAVAAAASAAASGGSPLPKGTGGSFRASGPLPLTLEWDQPHLILMSHIKGSNLAADRTPETRAEIAVAVNHFLEEHLETTLVMFHKDEPDLKRKLCGEVTRACQPHAKNKKKKKNSKSNAKPKVDTDQPDAPKEDL